MILRAVRHIFLAEFLAWVFFLLGGLLLGAVGAHFGSRRVSEILVLTWFALFLWMYRVLYKRL